MKMNLITDPEQVAAHLADIILTGDFRRIDDGWRAYMFEHHGRYYIAVDIDYKQRAAFDVRIEEVYEGVHEIRTTHCYRKDRPQWGGFLTRPWLKMLKDLYRRVLTR